jgi:exodeoxyribonuclease V alpha subunit
MSQANFSNFEKLAGIVERVTYHNEQNGWTVIKVSPFREPNRLVTVVVHQAKIFAGASMEFVGNWTQHPQHGEQFKAHQAIEKKPATTAALEKYLGSGLIKGVGPVTAARIVKHFREKTLEVFENKIEDLMSVPGIAEKKLADIKTSWVEHKAIRDVMIFLQGYGISTLFAVKIYKAYGDKAIEIVSSNPYRLARDIYGIGFFSADKIALSMGFLKNGIPRIEAGIKHVLASSREEGHCYLTIDQIQGQTKELLQVDEPDKVTEALRDLLGTNEIKKRVMTYDSGASSDCYYSKTLYHDEAYVAEKIKALLSHKIPVDADRVADWVKRYCEKEGVALSDEQQASVCGIIGQAFSILTGGPGCGKTTSTKVLVKLLQAMKKRLILAAPTGRAAQRMSEVIGIEAKTIHRLLEWAPNENGFKKKEDTPLEADFVIIDECSMLDISLTASLLKAIPEATQVLFIGDPDQLPSVGAGNVLTDLLLSGVIPKFELTKVFRQAEFSSIIRFAHKINKGEIPSIESPIADPEVFKKGVDCVFLDAEEATQEQARFIAKVKVVLKNTSQTGHEALIQVGDSITGRVHAEGNTLNIEKCFLPEFTKEELQSERILAIPDKFLHVNIEQLFQAGSPVEELKTVLKRVHPWSTLHLGMTALDTVLRVYTKTIPELLGKNCEIQILSPQVRGTLGTANLNQQIQAAINPPAPNKKEMTLGERVYRVGDRVIQTRNNYDLGVFNGDIGVIESIDLEEMMFSVYFSGHNQSFEYKKENLTDLQLAYGITIHKSQGSEFQAVIIPVATQHFKMLFRNLIYTGLTRGKKLVVFVGSRKALSMAVQTIDQKVRQTGLKELLLTNPPGH